MDIKEMCRAVNLLTAANPDVKDNIEDNPVLVAMMRIMQIYVDTKMMLFKAELIKEIIKAANK